MSSSFSYNILGCINFKDPKGFNDYNDFTI